MALPGRLQEIVDEFAGLPPELRLEALLDYSRRVPPLPRGTGAPGARVRRSPSPSPCRSGKGGIVGCVMPSGPR